MTAFEWYSFFLCLVVFILLSVLFGAMLAIITRQTVRIIRAGLEDESIKKEYLISKMKKRKQGCVESVLTFVLGLLMLGFFAFSLFVNITEDTYFNTFPTLRVVNSGSMAKKNEKNDYLVENNLNNHIQTFDMILTYRIPAEEDLKLYDIVVYEVDGIFVVHRIVGIEEPCESHPYNRYFLCQGDAVERPDRFPVYYSQMRGIYRDQRVPFIGSFVTFMQSPAGWLCVLLIVGSLVGVPLLEKKIEKEKRLRLLALGLMEESPTADAEEAASPTASPAPQVCLSEEEVPLPSPFAHLKGRVNTATFRERLSEIGDEVAARHDRIEELLSRFEGIRVIEARHRETYKRGNTPIVRMTVRGRTLNAYLALPPAELAGTKYIFEDLSERRAHAAYPIRVRVSSERQTRWTLELLTAIAKRLGIRILERPSEIPMELSSEVAPPPISPFAHLEGRKDTRSFAERLAAAPEETRGRYVRLSSALLAIPGIRVIVAKRQETYKCGNTPIARLAVKGKTLNAYLSLSPAALAGTKYIFTDLSKTRNFALYPTRIRLSSERQTRWALELLAHLLRERGLGKEDRT